MGLPLQVVVRGKVRSEMAATAFLAADVTGSSVSPEPFLNYVEKKYGELYQL